MDFVLWGEKKSFYVMHTHTSLLKCSLNHAEADGPMPLRESTSVQKYSTCPEAF